jgi:hypothetical protein
VEDSKYFMLGNPLSKQGAITLARDIAGITQMFSDMMKITLQANGIEVTPEIEQEITLYFKKQQEEYDLELFSKGIPKILQALLDYTRKGKLVAYCKRIIISEEELILLLHNCSQIGYTHHSKFIEYVPENRRLTKSDRTSMRQKEPKKFFSKIHAIFDERKNYMIHLFESGEKWHCFYYTYKELEPIGENRWKHGPHLHFVNYLWPEYRKRQVWESFNKRKHNIQGVHISLEPLPQYNPEGNQEFRGLTNAFVDKYKES